MYLILVSGYRPRYNREKLERFLRHSGNIAPMAKTVALDLLDGLTIEQMMAKYGRNRGYTSTLRARGRAALKLVLESNPERFGLEKIEPVAEGMTTKELAEYCSANKAVILSLVRRRRKIGLPAPERGGFKGWWFPAELANLYIENLGR